jgi:hypothetical protein
MAMAAMRQTELVPERIERASKESTRAQRKAEVCWAISAAVADFAREVDESVDWAWAFLMRRKDSIVLELIGFAGPNGSTVPHEYARAWQEMRKERSANA